MSAYSRGAGADAGYAFRISSLGKKEIRRIAGRHRRRCLSQLFKLGLNFRPLFWLALGRVGRIRMCEEFQEFGPNPRRSTTKVLPCERVEQVCVRLIVEPIFSGTRCFTGVKIVVRHLRLPGG